MHTTLTNGKCRMFAVDPLVPLISKLVESVRRLFVFLVKMFAFGNASFLY